MADYLLASSLLKDKKVNNVGNEKLEAKILSDN
jgi:hypothetical protein